MQQQADVLKLPQLCCQPYDVSTCGIACLCITLLQVPG